MRVYLSHPIRGSKGKDATPDEMRENNLRALDAGHYWKDLLGHAFNQLVDMYIPGEHDEFVLLAYQNGYLTEQQILAVDCKILDTCDMLLALNEDCISGGMRVEIDYALKNGIPVLYVKSDTTVLVEVKKPFDVKDLKRGDRVRVQIKHHVDGSYASQWVAKAAGIGVFAEHRKEWSFPYLIDIGDHKRCGFRADEIIGGAD